MEGDAGAQVNHGLEGFGAVKVCREKVARPQVAILLQSFHRDRILLVLRS